jgi:hypothetical protein
MIGRERGLTMVDNPQCAPENDSMGTIVSPLTLPSPQRGEGIFREEASPSVEAAS